MQASTNGVFVNDVKIDEHPLEHGDVVQFGGAADIAVGTRFDGSGSHIRCKVETYYCACFFVPLILSTASTVQSDHMPHRLPLILLPRAASNIMIL